MRRPPAKYVIRYELLGGLVITYPAYGTLMAVMDVAERLASWTSATRVEVIAAESGELVKRYGA